MSFYKSASSPIRKSNLAFVLIFAVIAIAGMVLIVSGPSGQTGRDYVAPDSVQVPGESVEKAQGFGIYYFLLKTVLFTAVIIVFILIIARIVRVRSAKTLAVGGDIRIIGRKYLSPKQYLLLIEVSGKRLLLGVTESNISMLASFNTEDSFQREAEDVLSSGEEKIIERFKLKKKE